MITSKDFKKMISVLLKNTDIYFNPVIVHNNEIVVSDRICIFEYQTNMEDCDIGISLKDIGKIKKSKNIEFNHDSIVIDDYKLENDENRMIYDAKSKLFSDAEKTNTMTFPVFTLENVKCKYLIFNSSGILYVTENNEIAKEVSCRIDGMEKLGYVCMQYKYIKAIFDMYKHFGIVPVVKFGSSRNIIFESQRINGILMLMNYEKAYIYRNYKIKNENEW